MAATVGPAAAAAQAAWRRRGGAGTSRPPPLLPLLAGSAVAAAVLALLGTSPRALLPPGPLRLAARLHLPVRLRAPERREAVLRRALEGEEVRYVPLNFNLDKPLVPETGALVLPCFPLGDFVYTPCSQHVLRIFEPRYRAMYNDILLTGGRRFVVPQMTKDEVTGRYQLAEVGVVFYLDDLQEVSEQTNDEVKYVCTHSVIGRVRLKRVLNPRAFADRSTYLRVEAEDLIDTDLDEDHGDAEERLMQGVYQVAALQKTAEPTVRFTEEALIGQNATRGPGFWRLVDLWQEYLGFRIRECQTRFERQLEAKLMAYFEDKKSADPRGELPEEIQKEIKAMQDELQEEARPLLRAQRHRSQVLVQSDSHADRLRLLQGIVDEDKRRLEARLAIKAALGD